MTTLPFLTLGRPAVLPGAARGLSQRTLVTHLRLDAPAPTGLEARLREALPPAVNEALPPATSESPADLAGRLCLALQTAARQPVEGHRVLPTPRPEVVELAVAVHAADVGLAALHCAVRALTLQAATPSSPQSTSDLVQSFLNAAMRGGPVLPNTATFIRSARRLGLPWRALEDGVFQFGWGAQARRLEGAFTDSTSIIATRMVRKKPVASRLMAQAGIPVPRQLQAASEEACLAAAQQIGYPVVVKPPAQDQGIGVSVHLQTPDAVRQAYATAMAHGRSVLVEQHVHGEDHRLLIVHGRLLAAARRRAASVIGDGRSSVRDLVARLNQDPRRGAHEKSLLQRIELDDNTLAVLAEQGLTPDSLPATGQTVVLRRTSNISNGGTAEDVTSIIHPDNAELAVRAARVVGLDIAGVDFLCPDISRSWLEVGGAVCEVNAQPGFRPHWLADPTRDLNGEILRTMFGTSDGRIPLACLSGSDSAVVGPALQGLLVQLGIEAGWASRQAVRIGARAVPVAALPSTHAAAQMLLIDPQVQAAVIDQPLPSVRDEGFAFDRCDVTCLLDLQPTPELPTEAERRHWAAEVLHRARHAMVINADDALCMQLAPLLPAHRLILVTTDAQHRALAAHLASGLRAVTWGTAQPMLWHGKTAHPLPASLQPRQIWAAAIAWSMGHAPEVISAALHRVESARLDAPASPS